MHSNIDSVTSGQVRIKCHLGAKHMKNITYLFAISITKIHKNRFRVVSGVPSAEVYSGSKQSFDPSHM